MQFEKKKEQQTPYNRRSKFKVVEFFSSSSSRKTLYLKR
jgi:hypothetical protein